MPIRKPKEHRMVTSFPDMYMAMLMKAAQDGKAGPVRLLHGKAVNLRHTLYELRKAMREEGHPLSELAQTVTIYLEPDTESNVVRQNKAGEDVYEYSLVTARTGGEAAIEDAMRAAGITLDSVNEAYTGAPVAPPPTELPRAFRAVEELGAKPLPIIDYQALLPKEED